MSDRLKELEKEVQKEKLKKHKEFLKSIKEKHGFKKGDIVEFVRETRSDNGYDFDFEWCTSEILDFEQYHTTSPIRVKLKGEYYSYDICDINHFHENDYSFRHNIWNRELDINDEIQLIVDKPKSTKGKKYIIEEVHKKRDSNIEYLYYNDNGKLQTLYENEYNMTHK